MLRVLTSLLLLLATLGLVACGDDDDDPTGPGGCGQPTNPAPTLALETSSGTTVDLGALRCQDVVVVEFWATWAASSRATLADLQQIHTDFASRGVTVLGVNLSESPAAITAFGQENALDFPLIVDENGTVARAFAAPAPGARYLIDATGSLREELDIGQASDLAQSLEDLLAGN